MGRNKGLCAICGSGVKLTFEHIPPQCAFNKKGVTTFTFQDWERAGGDFDKMTGGRPQPDGTGTVALCARCNNVVTGDWYVPTFCQWVRTAADLFKRLGSIKECDQELGRMLSVYLQATRPLALIKEVVAIALTLNAEQDPSFRTKHPDLVSFVLERDRTGLPPRYQVYLVLYAGPAARFVPLAGIQRPPKQVVWLTAVDHPPLAYVLTIDEPHDFLPLGKVTSFADVPYREERDLTLEMLVGFGHTAFPGDYRSTAAIEEALQLGVKDTGSPR